MSEKNKLILGAAGGKSTDAVTLDINPKHNPDVVHDLNKTPWPFKDDQFKNICCHHVLEHLTDIYGPMQELHRICASDGQIYIELPHYSCWQANTPHHKLRFSYFALDGYLRTEGTKWLATERKFEVLERKITFHRAYRRYFLHRIFNRFPLQYERFWTYIIPAEHLIFRIRAVK